MSRQLALSSALSIMAMAMLALFTTAPAQSSPFAPHGPQAMAAPQ